MRNTYLETYEDGAAEMLRDEIAEAHAKGRAHWTETPRPQQDEVEALRRQVEHLRRCLGQQNLIHALVDDLDVSLGNMQIGARRDSMEHIRATSMRDRIAQFRRDWRDAK